MIIPGLYTVDCTTGSLLGMYYGTMYVLT